MKAVGRVGSEQERARRVGDAPLGRDPEYLECRERPQHPLQRLGLDSACARQVFDLHACARENAIGHPEVCNEPKHPRHLKPPDEKVQSGSVLASASPRVFGRRPIFHWIASPPQAACDSLMVMADDAQRQSIYADLVAVIDRIAALEGRPITPETELYYDLGSAGDDPYEVIEAVRTRFGTDFSGMGLRADSPGETDAFLSLDPLRELARSSARYRN